MGVSQANSEVDVAAEERASARARTYAAPARLAGLPADRLVPGRIMSDRIWTDSVRQVRSVQRRFGRLRSGQGRRNP